MTSSASFVIPGHNEPLGAWSVGRLECAREDFLFDLDNGYLPDDTRAIVMQICDELERRESGEPQQMSDGATPAASRALNRWFEAEPSTIPTLRGEATAETTAASEAPPHLLAIEADVALADPSPVALTLAGVGAAAPASPELEL